MWEDGGDAYSLAKGPGKAQHSKIENDRSTAQHDRKKLGHCSYHQLAVMKFFHTYLFPVGAVSEKAS